jgi:hypothetical protein
MNHLYAAVHIQANDAMTPDEEMLFMSSSQRSATVLPFMRATSPKSRQEHDSQANAVTTDMMKNADKIKRISSDSYLDDMQEQAEVKTLRSAPRHVRGVKPGVPRVAQRWC